jgi:hypothetical protein
MRERKRERRGKELGKSRDGGGQILKGTRDRALYRSVCGSGRATRRRSSGRVAAVGETSSERCGGGGCKEGSRRIGSGGGGQVVEL